MREDLLYWVWVTLCFPPANPKMLQLLEELTPREIYERQGSLPFPFLGAEDVRRLKKVPLAMAEGVLERCGQLGVHILTMQDEDYPRRLLHIEFPPPVLYCQGSLANLDQLLTIGIVGTRSVNDYYRRATGNVSFQLARAGAVIVSGCAAGCDEYAHLGALRAKGVTVGVLACGFGVNYPAKTEYVRKEIPAQGALISELPPGTKEDRHYFRIRNRLIAGLSEGVLAAQTPTRSGALLTITHALEQGKDIFCLPPNDIFSNTCMGIAPAIRDGAQVILSARDILDYYLSRFEPVLDMERMPAADMTGSRPGKRPAKAAPEKKKRAKDEPGTSAPPDKTANAAPAPLPEWLTDQQRQVLLMLGEGPKQVEELMESTGLASYQLLTRLTELAGAGLGRMLSGLVFERMG